MDPRAFIEELGLAALGIEPLAPLAPVGFKPPDGSLHSAHAPSAGRFWDLVASNAPGSSGEKGESAFRSTMRVARGDLARKYADQLPSRAGRILNGAGDDLEHRAGFSRVAADDTDGAPLRGFIHPPLPGHPIVLLVHGLFDSKRSGYIRIVAEAFAAGGFGVFVPDMRWHGELLSPDWPATLGIVEGADLVAWGAWIARRYPSRTGIPGLASHADHPIGLVGFSLGALNVIHALAHSGASDIFRAGGIVFSPPANLDRTRRVLDVPASFFELGMESFLIGFFQQAMAQRMGDLVRADEPAPRASAPGLFTRFLEWLAPRMRLAGVGELLRMADPLAKLADCRRPLLLVTGANDPIYRSPTAPDFAAASAESDWVRAIETPHGGHIGHLGCYPDWCAGLFGRFFSLSNTVVDAAARSD